MLHQKRHRARKRLSLPWLSLFLIIISFSVLVVGCNKDEKSDDTAEENSKPTPREILTPVEVGKIVRTTLTSRLIASGSILPSEEVTINSASGGVILVTHVSDGDKVERGQILFELDSSLEAITLRELEADLKAATADRAAIDIDGAEKRLAREKKLLSDGYSSQEKYDRVEADVRTAKSQLLSIDARTERLEASIDRVQKKIADSKLKSPIAGSITGRNCHRGQRISVGETMARVICLNPVLIEIQIGERNIGWLKPGMKAKIGIEAYSGRSFAAFIRTISPDADPTTRAFTVRLEAENATEMMRPGMFAEVKLPTRRQEGALVAPVDAIVRRGGDVIAFVIEDEPALARKRNVKVGERHQDIIEILSGLQENETVVVAGNLDLRDGERVYVIETQNQTKSPTTQDKKEVPTADK
ncbi:efflux RND transporter periplasmic adaptor subunit [candidate division CSSED10-310 bacterium]|uniref:Efflux RND transporter periplasmic adaptor subunit n=1 Tax=candidate division CSSED10-310 bacterium TaxID=2855610 RepID=A0ABV6YZ30_UNCC1